MLHFVVNTMLLKSFVIFGVVVVFAAAFPGASDPDDSGNTEENVSLCEGRGQDCNDQDEYLLASEALYSTNGDIIGPQDRSAIFDDRLRWPNGVIPYVIDNTVNEELRKLIINGMRKVTSRTNSCIRFVRRTNQAAYVIFHNPSKKLCQSNIGMTGRAQVIYLGIGCNRIGTVIHEILHAVGFNHEHNRSDRDKYIVVNFNNVEKGKEKNFNKAVRDRLYNGFDYYSIMIYGEYSFAFDRSKKTLWDRTRKHTITDPFTKNDLTNSDVFRIKSLYKCK